MSWKNVFIESLKEWNEGCSQKDSALNNLLFHLGYRIGIREGVVPTLEQFEKRIDLLINENKINEQFLIKSLLQETSSYLNRMISYHGEAIIVNEHLNASYKEDPGITMPHVEKTLTDLKSMKYLFMAEHQIDTWNSIVIRNFSLTRERELERESFQRIGRHMKNK